MSLDEDRLLMKAGLLALGIKRSLLRDFNDWIEQWIEEGKEELHSSPSDGVTKADLENMRDDIIKSLSQRPHDSTPVEEATMLKWDRPRSNQSDHH
ncbi:MAG: hypothetical protein AB7G68_14125 [Nitrospiraceae bacterium]